MSARKLELEAGYVPAKEVDLKQACMSAVLVRMVHCWRCIDG